MMRSIWTLIFASALAMTTVSCGLKADKNDPLYVEVVAIHDEVMPKMSTMHKLKKKLRKLKAADQATTASLIAQLNAADEGMMQWMADFSPPEEKAARKTYLEGQLGSVTKMADDINSAIEAAETYLSSQK